MNRIFAFRRLGVLVAGVLLTAAAAHAQSTTEGAIGGTVEDPTGAAIPGAAVTIHNDGTNQDIHLKADGSGFFKAPLLQPGTYTVTIDATGFAPYSATNVVVQVGQMTSVLPHLNTGAAQTTVQVTADTPAINLESPDDSTVLNRAAVDNIPVQNRRWSALALTTPGVVADSSGFGLVSVRGMSTLMNNVEIDGADDNQAFYSEERGRTREGYSTSENAVREFQVNTGVYSAEFGRAAGGVINSVTKSGTNTMHGEFYASDLDRGWGAFDPGSVSATGQPLKPKDLRKIYGFSMGGALIKDRLFWYYTFDKYAHINPAIARAKSYGSSSTPNSFLDQPDAAGDACNIATGTLAGSTKTIPNYTLDSQVCTMGYDLGLASYSAAETYYDNSLTSLEGDLGIVPRAGWQEINTPKVDWQIDNKNRLSLIYHRLRWDAPGDVQTSSAADYAVDAFGEDFVKLDYGVAELATQISTNISNEALYQYSRELDDEGQQPYSAYTTSNLVATGGTGTNGLVNGPGGTIPYVNLTAAYAFYAGSPYYSYRKALPDEHKYQVHDILYWNLGNHSIRLGADLVHNNDYVNQQQYYFGYYTYANLASYFTDLGAKPSAPPAAGTRSGACGGVGCYEYMSQDFGPSSYQINTFDYAGFIQDNWKATSRLTLELGLRYDYEQLPAPSPNLTTATGSFVPYAGLNNHPSDKNNFGPRVGFSMDVFGNGHTVVRGGVGMYYGRIINSTLENTLFGTGSPNSQYATANLAPSVGSTFPYPLAAGSGTKPSSIFLSPHLQNPEVNEFDLQVEQTLGRGTVMQVSYLGALGREEPNFLNVNLAPPEDTATITVAPITNGAQGPLPAGATYKVPTFGTCTASASCPYPTGYINPNFSNIVEFLSNINSSYNGLTFAVQNNSLRNLQFEANYTWAHALDFNQNASTTISGSTNNWLNPYASQRQNYGTSQFNVGNRFVGYVLYNFPHIHTGGPLKWVVNGWSINDTFQMQNGLPYSAEVNSGKNSNQALNSGTWNGVNGVYYIPVIGLNTYQVPRAVVDDARLQKEFRFASRYNLQLSADLYNVANHQNFSTSDINEDAYNFSGQTTTSSTITYIPNTAPGVGFGSHSTSNDSGFLYTPREFQIMARLEF